MGGFLKTRRALLGAPAGGAALVLAASVGDRIPADGEYLKLFQQLRRLSLTESFVDHANPEQSQAYYRDADIVMAAVLASKAIDATGWALKAEAIAWCCGSRTDFALGSSTAEQLMASLLVDLLSWRDRPGATPIES